MTLDELAALCQEAARDLMARHGRPIPATVIVPGPGSTAVTSLPDFPDDDRERFDFLSHFAADRMQPTNAAAYGFLGEAELATGDGAVDVVVVVYGARRHRPLVTAAPLGEELGSFSHSEPLDPTAMPFLSPLQHVVDAAQPPDVTGIGN